MYTLAVNFIVPVAQIYPYFATFVPATRLTRQCIVGLRMSYLGTIENHGNTEITETVIFVKCRDFDKIPCLPCFLAKMPCFMFLQ